MALILVIDDDDAVRGMLRATLERAGHSVEEACNGFQGLSKFEIQPVPLVVTDIVMPDCEGIETILALRKKSKQVKIIAISGGGRMPPDQYLEQARVLGADAVFRKPVDRRVLLSTIASLLGEGEPAG